jgi:hypothetical protein
VTATALCLVVLGQSSLVLGTEAFGEFFPRSSVVVPNMTDHKQQSVLTGPRLTAGYQYRDLFRVLGVFDFGYAAAGLKAGDGNDGFMVGAGLEADAVVHRWLLPFVRATYDLKLVTGATGPNGSLASDAFVFSVGVRALRFLDVHFATGHDFAGGWSIGFGAGLGWSWSFALE